MNSFFEILHKLFGFTLPERAAEGVQYVDNLYNFIMFVSVVGFVGMVGVMIYFVIRYHHTQNDKSAYIPGSHVLETIWTAIPAALYIGIAIWGLVVYFDHTRVSKDAYKVNVIGKQWAWEFQYEHNGQKFSTLDVLYVPVDTEILLDMTSTDVVHSFFIPSARLKKDVVPGMRTLLTFKPTKLGDMQVFCAEFCGTSHSRMLATIKVLSKKKFEAFLERESKNANVSDPVELGARLVQRKGCFACHSADGSRIVGPTFKGLWGRETTTEAGEKITVDADYIRESIIAPQAKVVKGYPNSMNSFAGQLSEEEIDSIIEFLKTIK